MGKSRNKKPLLEKITITGVAAEGKSFARHNDQVIFVPFVIPGDVVDIQVTKKRKKYMEGNVTHIHEYSLTREKAFCSHFGICGGCKWQILPYAEQIKQKQQQVNDALVRIGKIASPKINDILASNKTQYYRNKLEYTFSEHRWLPREAMDNPIKEINALGFHIPGLFDKIIDIEHCYLQPEPSNKIRLGIRDFAIKHNFSFYNQRNNYGFLRNLIVRTSSTGEVMVIVVFGEQMDANINLLMQYIVSNFGDEITSLQYIINTKLNDSYSDLNVISYSGKPFIHEKMDELIFKIGPKSFYQTNSEQAHNLYKIVKEYAQLKGNELVYDLYTGTGTIACFLANDCKSIIGIEYIEAAVADARENAKLNNLNNTLFFAGDMKDVLNEQFIAQHGKPHVIITDPPRAGMHPDVIESINRCAPEKIVYVSCNPATQARDIELLDENYRVEKIQPVDMFPHTHHVENVVLLVKR